LLSTMKWATCQRRSSLNSAEKAMVLLVVIG